LITVQSLGKTLGKANTGWSSAIRGVFRSGNTGVGGISGRSAGGGSTEYWDFSAFRDIHLTEAKALQFRAEFFNILNHTNFHLPNSDISSPTFNHILKAEPPRLAPFGLKLRY
jgi:hypothetical protein